MLDVLDREMLTLAAMMLVTGAAGGVIAGMLGVGGGIVIVPVLDLVLSSLGIDSDIRMHVTVATSLATIIPTAISSSRAHEAKGAVDHDQLKRWGIAIFLDEEMAVGMIVASEVATVTCIRMSESIPSAERTRSSTGTITMPPPTPSMPAITPPAAPVTSIIAASVSISPSSISSIGFPQRSALLVRRTAYAVKDRN